MTTTKHGSISAIAMITVCLGANTVFAEERATTDWQEEVEIGVLAGLSQPLFLKGGNVQLEARYRRFVLDYSHGWSLDIPTVGDAKEQGLGMHLPYSTGLGLGYKFTQTLDVRFEPKLHRFDVHYDRDESVLASYKTVTLGLGVYYSYRPFKTNRNFLKGLTIAASVRWWQNVWTDLEQEQFEYDNTQTGRREVHEVSNIGIANTPVILNLSIGYVFTL